MSNRRLAFLHLFYWVVAATLLFLNALSYGHPEIALVRHIYFLVLALILSTGFVAADRLFLSKMERPKWAREISAGAFVLIGAVLLALALNPLTFALIGSPSLTRPGRILSMDTLYFVLFLGIWSALYLRLAPTSAEASVASNHDEASLYVSSLQVSGTEGLQNIDVAGLEALIAEGDYVRLVTSGRAYLKNATLSGLLEELDPATFVRVHRSVAVNRAHVVSVSSLGRGAFEIVLTSGETIQSSRSYKEAVQGLVPTV